MTKFLFRTSLTIDEAVGHMLGLLKGPYVYEPDEDASPEDEEALDSDEYCLGEGLEDEVYRLRLELGEAKRNKAPEDQITRMREAIHNVQARAFDYLCAIKDELSKGENSALRVDRELSSKADCHITLASLHEWANGKYGISILDSESILKTDGGSTRNPTQENVATGKPIPLPKLRQQEQAILGIIKNELGHDPKQLPDRAAGKRGVKAQVRPIALQDDQLFGSDGVFDKAWDRLRKANDIVGGE